MIETQTTYGQRTDAIENARGQVPWWLSPLYLILRPGRFMLGFGYHAPLAVVLLAAWLAGSGRMTNWVVNQQRLSVDPVPWRLDSWAMLWLLLLGLGLLRGVFEYALGGLWTWLRLRICGVRGNQWGLSTRIYLFARLVEMVPLLLLLLYFSVKFSTVDEYLRASVGIANYIAGAFMFVAPITAFLMVRTINRVRSLWAAVLFLIIPLLWRMILVLGALWMANQGGGRYAGPYPGTHRPMEYSSQHIGFDVPQGWEVIDSGASSDAIPIDLRVLGDDQFAELLIRVQDRNQIDPVGHDLEQLAHAGREVSDGVDEPNVRIANQAGNGVEYRVGIEGRAYKMYQLIVQFDVNHDVLFRFTASDPYWWHAMEGWKQVLGSIEIGDLYGIVPDVSEPTRVQTDDFMLDMPGNWHRVDWGKPPFSHTQIAAMQYTWFVVSIYDRDMSAQDELDMYLNHTIDDKVMETIPMNEWLGLQGVGVEGRLRENLAGTQRFKTLYVPLSDGRVLVLDRVQAESSVELTNPGFQLIEDTFQLRGVEPASP